MPHQRIVFIVPHREGRSPGQRFRFEQYLTQLQNNGFEILFLPLLSKEDDFLFYNGSLFQKILLVARTFLKRRKHVKQLRNDDIVFIYREAHFLGTIIFEKMIRKRVKKMAFDFDDAIWLKDVSAGNQKLAFLKRPEKTADIIALCDAVIAGNSFLASYAQKFCRQVEVIPTTIDLLYHKTKTTVKKERVCIGWTGTQTTVKHFMLLTEVFKRLKKKYGHRIFFKLISDSTEAIPELNLSSTKWKLESEIEQLSEIDIGVMPLPDDEWSKGKCGFKGLQYMSLSIPTVMSPVGVNTEIISDGVNGFIAQSESEWFEKLSLLIDDETLRKQLGKKGFETIVERYSVSANSDKYVNFFQALTS